MTVDDIIRDFATTGTTLPRSSMQWTLDNWDEAGPRLINVLERFISGDDTSDDATNVLFFALHLMAEMNEKGAFAPLCRLITDHDAIERILGDGITTTLTRIMISTFDGDIDLLKTLIENQDADQFVRYSAMQTWTYQIYAGLGSRDDAKQYLLDLFDTMKPQGECFVWVGWVDAVMMLGMNECRDRVASLMDRGFIDYRHMRMDDFEREIAVSLDDPKAAFSRDRILPLDDCIGELAGWYCFTEKYQEDQARMAAHREKQAYRANLPEPFANPFKSVGRNDPCPCGSGKKFKKCCLH
ncbi:SEC-C motif domain-containing protein [Paramagnetospirillum caucaseum]|uniref:SEC-C motif domain-containing protein n=1 Tax=Paramagnetospirillum caucaseum TaxID=1244869 RepID=M3A535_9PROT|nr:DUF1186 domain-containing protein [Paramagnetospirillum caucaseum]EME67943.1 SEC-C motif domain-containing protein [Paramagnetospirillum caucaseum]